MRLLKNIQRLTLSTVLVVALSACSSKDNSDANATAQTGGTFNTHTNQTTQNDNNTHTDSNATSDNDSNTETNATTDVTPPVITLNGQTSITLQQNTAYTELGATAVDAVDGNLTVSISGTVDTSTAGEYTLTYTATDSAGNEANLTRNVNVILPPDVTPPVITLNGESTVTVFQDTPYTELSAIATDVRDANVSVSVSGSVDVSTLGSYIITYTAVDSAGNRATAQRTVNVVLSPDTEAPVITLNGDVNITLTLGESYEELGATATDNRDGDVNVTISGSVDAATVGTYTVTYTATDKAGNKATTTRTVTVVAPTLTSISVESNVTTLNLGEKAELTVMATYSDGSTSALDTNVEYIITPSDSVDVNGSVLTARKDGNVTVQAKINGVLSNTLNLTITWVVNGHVLPPEPDPVENDATLGGVDSNSNGVRDDVERWIYETYDHPIERGIFMQSARAYQKVIVDPSKAHETVKYMDNQLACEFYWRYDARENNESFQLDKFEARETAKKIKKLQFNTLKRHMAYERYNAEFSGEVFGAPKSSKEKCEFNKNGILRDLK